MGKAPKFSHTTPILRSLHLVKEINGVGYDYFFVQKVDQEPILRIQ